MTGNKIKNIFRRAGKIMIYICAGLVVILISLFLFLYINSSNEPEQVKDENGNVISGSISEKIFVQIGGIKQGMILRERILLNRFCYLSMADLAFRNIFFLINSNPVLKNCSLCAIGTKEAAEFHFLMK